MQANVDLAQRIAARVWKFVQAEYVRPLMAHRHRKQLIAVGGVVFLLLLINVVVPHGAPVAQKNVNATTTATTGSVSATETTETVSVAETVNWAFPQQQQETTEATTTLLHQSTPRPPRHGGVKLPHHHENDKVTEAIVVTMATDEPAATPAETLFDADPYKIKYAIPKHTAPAAYWSKFDVYWKHVYRSQSLAFLDQYLSELERETLDMMRDFDNAIEQRKIDIQWRLDHADNESAPVPVDDVVRVRDCVRQLMPLLGREEPLEKDALVFNGTRDRYDGAWLDKSWILASTGQRVAGGAQSAKRCLGERWVMFLGDDNARGMYDATIERLSTLPDWRIDEIGSSAGSAGDRDTLFVNRLYEPQADGHVEHRMMYISFRRVASFTDRNKLDAVLRDPRAVYAWSDVGGSGWAFDKPLLVAGLDKSIFANHTQPDVTVVSLGQGDLPAKAPRTVEAAATWLADTMKVASETLTRLRDALEPETFREKKAGKRVVYRLISKNSESGADNYSILRLNRAVADTIRRVSRGHADILDPWKFFPTYINRNISLSLDALHLEESIDDLKDDNGATDSPQLQRLLVDVVLDQLCDHLAEDRAEEARQQFAAAQP
jgi:hypothetical protein